MYERIPNGHNRGRGMFGADTSGAWTDETDPNVAAADISPADYAAMFASPGAAASKPVVTAAPLTITTGGGSVVGATKQTATPQEVPASIGGIGSKGWLLLAGVVAFFIWRSKADKKKKAARRRTRRNADVQGNEP